MKASEVHGVSGLIALRAQSKFDKQGREHQNGGLLVSGEEGISRLAGPYRSALLT